MPIYKGRRPGTYRVVVWARGVAHEAIVEGLAKDAKAFEAKRRLELDAGAESSTRRAPSFRDFCEARYGPHAERHLRSSTWNKVRVYQVATLCGHFGSMRLSDLRTDDVETFKECRLKDGTGPSSINNELRVLRAILNWARTLGYPVAPVLTKPLPIRGSPRVHVWTAAEVRRLFDAAAKEAPQLLPMLVFMVNTGVRKGEAIAAEWSWVDMPRRMLRIPSTDAWRPKNGLPREVPISDSLAALLRGPQMHPTWLFPTRHGGRFSEFPKDLFWRVRTAANLKGGPHTTRHTFASMFLANCPDMFLLAKVLGHSHTRITEIYSHLLPDHLSRARNAVNLGTGRKTMAEAMATKPWRRRSPKNSSQRH